MPSFLSLMHIEQTSKKKFPISGHLFKKTLNTPKNTMSSKPQLRGRRGIAYTSPGWYKFYSKIIKKKDDFKSRPYHVRLF
jgi:hypothetical protein